MGKRCQVCDGPIKSGRCSFCGMPYRSDEELYHLNETRSAHYQHSSKKVRKIMRSQEIALPDQKERGLTEENPQAVQTLGDVLKKKTKKVESVREEQKRRLQPKQESFKTNQSTSANKARTTGYAGTAGKSNQQRTGSSSMSMKETENKKKISAVTIMIIVVFISMAIQFLGEFADSFSDQFGNTFTWDDVEESINGEEEIWYDEDDQPIDIEEAYAGMSSDISFFISSEEALPLISGKEVYAELLPDKVQTGWDEGYYLAVMENGFGTLHRVGKQGATDAELSRYNNYLIFDMSKDQSIVLAGANSKDAMIWVYSINPEL